jgi:four helix bundle protein
MAKTLDDLLVWKKALEFWEAVNALLDRPEGRKNRDLRDQIRDAIDSVVSNISEGFEQPTDRAFARYLYHAKASAAETRARLFIAWRRGYIGDEDHRRTTELSDELCRMLTGLIKYLHRSDKKQRGTGATSD